MSSDSEAEYEDFDDDDVDEVEKFWDFKIKFCISMILISIASIAVLILYRKSRPKELESFFNVFDDKLKGTQDWIDATVDNLFMDETENVVENENMNIESQKDSKMAYSGGKMNISNGKTKNKTVPNSPITETVTNTPITTNTMPTEISKAAKLKNNEDQLLQIEIIKFKTEYKKKKKKMLLKHQQQELIKAEEKDDFWEEINKKMAKRIEVLQQKRDELLEELKKVREERLKHFADEAGGDGEIKTFNADVIKIVKGIKASNFKDEKGKEIRESFEAVHELLFKTAILRSFKADLARRRAFVAKVKAKFENESEERGKIRQAMVNAFNFLYDLGESGLLLSSPHLFLFHKKHQELKQRISESFDNFLKGLPKAVKLKLDAFNLGTSRSREFADLIVKSQELEKELFKLESRDFKYHEKISRIIGLSMTSKNFLNEFELLLRHDQKVLKKRLDQILGKQQDRISKMKTGNLKDANLSLIESWHRRNLLELFTNMKLFPYTTDGFRLKHIKGYLANYIEWYADMKKIKDQTIIFTERIDPESDDINEFKLDRVLVDYRKIRESQRSLIPIRIGDEGLGFKTQEADKQVILSKGSLFTMVNVYRRLAESKNVKRIRELWPKPGKTDESFLMHPDTYEKQESASKNRFIRMIEDFAIDIKSKVYE